MKNKTILFLILILSFNIPLIYSATEEGYGEGNDNLGQFTDTFENANNITVMDDVIVNTTLECVELNISSTGGSKLYENYTEYTEVDVGADRIVIHNDTHVEHRAQRNEDTYLYYDYGVDYFGDFTHDFDWEAFYFEVGGLGHPWVLSQTVVDDARGIFNTANEKAILVRLYRHTANRRFILMYYSGGGVIGDSDAWLAPMSLTIYYVRIVKSGTSVVCGIYSTSILRNAGDGTDGDIINLSVTMEADHKFRYIYAVNTWNDAEAIDIIVDVYNLWIGKTSLGGYEPDGYFMTEDYLNYTTGNSLTLLTNTSIPYGTSITIQVSNDNSSWVLNDWEPIFGGFEAVDLRILNYSDIYFMYNFTGTPTLTPRLYQSRLVTTNGTSGVGGIVYVDRFPTHSLIMLILLLTIGSILVYGVSRRK